jgi:hypothetical protein
MSILMLPSQQPVEKLKDLTCPDLLPEAARNLLLLLGYFLGCLSLSWALLNYLSLLPNFFWIGRLLPRPLWATQMLFGQLSR